MELSSDVKKLKALGVNLIGVTYDSLDITKDFAQKSKLDFPLLADPEIKMISSFGVMEKPRKKGSNSRPAAFLFNEKGILIARYLDAVTVRSPLEFHMLLYGGPKPTQVQSKEKSEHADFRLWVNKTKVKKKDRVFLGIDIDLKKDLKIGAPGDKSKITAIEWKLKPNSNLRINTVNYPPSGKAKIQGAKEVSSVYEGSIRLTRIVDLYVKKTS